MWIGWDDSLTESPGNRKVTECNSLTEASSGNNKDAEANSLTEILGSNLLGDSIDMLQCFFFGW